MGSSSASLYGDVVNINKPNVMKLKVLLQTFSKQELVKMAYSWSGNSGCDFTYTPNEALVDLIMESLQVSNK